MAINMTNPRTESIDAYIQATTNECVTDKVLATVDDSAAWLPHRFPRPLQFAATLPRWPLAVQVAFQAALLFWLPLLAILNMLHAVRLTWHMLKQRHNKMPINGQIALATSARMATILARVPADQQPDTLVTLPWCKPIPMAENRQTIGLLQAARIGDIWWSYWSALIGAWQFARQSELRADRWQTYTSFRWFFTWRVLSRQSEIDTIWFCNHYDRWAVLVDRLPLQVTRILIQHGFARSELQLPVRLEQIDAFYYFDEQTKQTLLDMTLPDKSKLRMERLTATINLRSLPRDSDQRHLLFISQPVDQVKEAVLLRAILKKFPDLQVWLKPHPLYSSRATREFSETTIKVIEEADFFPDVEVAISGQSWLGVEYEGSGVPVVWHWGKNAGVVLAEITAILEKSDDLQVVARAS
ncbi:hypothetical protein FF011L_46330 [Roseimaritima multifibrata]|uniref:Uncharacterized protein n=2 Tax=Roseimaritima multifibrata TaxID=1930274 RepID=A0A517MLS2_9BACT|nr:hypothetical protein FF011L_46330 [Roseimaritima multifibrata]